MNLSILKTPGYTLSFTGFLSSIYGIAHTTNVLEEIKTTLKKRVSFDEIIQTIKNSSPTSCLNFTQKVTLLKDANSAKTASDDFYETPTSANELLYFVATGVNMLFFAIVIVDTFRQRREIDTTSEDASSQAMQLNFNARRARKKRIIALASIVFAVAQIYFISELTKPLEKGSQIYNTSHRLQRSARSLLPHKPLKPEWKSRSKNGLP